MLSKRDLEGYVSFDHRNSPGIPEDVAVKGPPGTIPIRPGQHFQSATTNCSNCRALIILNPLRTRERHWCSKCNDYHCDHCALMTKISGQCIPMKQRIDEFLRWAARTTNGV